MDRVEICTTTPVDGLVTLNIKNLIECNGELVIELNDNECYNINEGDKLSFIRHSYCENGDDIRYVDDVFVKYEDSEHKIHTTLLQRHDIYLDPNNNFEFFYENDYSYYILHCDGNHYFYQQDIAAAGQEVYFRNENDEIIYTASSIYTINSYTKRPITIDDCLTRSEKLETCGKNFDYVTRYYYSFVPESENIYHFAVDDFVKTICSKATHFSTKFNKYYYYTIETNEKGEPTELDNYGNPVKHCVFYGDIWWDGLRDTTTKKYVLENPNTSMLCEFKDYYSVNLGIANDSNETVLGGEDMFSKLFATSIEESLIPEFIDMEKVKYIPYRKVNNTTYFPVTKITIYPHFRERVLLDPENNTNTFATSGNLYYDGWYIDTEDNASKYWNGYTGTDFSQFNNFVSTNGKTADLIGYLNFNDKDIYYRKNKVSKSFFRFLFYNSNNPIEQKLLSYSTVFIDSTDLYSKYIKQFMFIEDNKNITDQEHENYVIINPITSGNQNVNVVFCENENVGCRLDSKITITNEYDKSKSAEGFNIYLFSDDIPEGNSGKTIYMKIEFNHAGNGKTIPMVMQPKDIGGNYMPLTIDNFIENLYIPIDIKKFGDKYIYTIQNAEYDQDGNIELILFEPKLEIE